MKGYRFYLEYPNKTEKNKGTVKSPGNHCGTVVAMLVEEAGRGYRFLHYHYKPDVAEGIGSVLYEANSPVCVTGVAMGHLKDKCKRIPERLARQIHPRLFEYLEG